MDNRAIGVFDSGIGGLTVVNALTTVLPNEKIIYVGDTARVPYGNKSIDSIRQYSLEITKWLLKKNCKMIVVACNTVSSLVLDYLTSYISIPIIGVISKNIDAVISICGTARGDLFDRYKAGIFSDGLGAIADDHSFSANYHFLYNGLGILRLLTPKPLVISVGTHDWGEDKFDLIFKAIDYYKTNGSKENIAVNLFYGFHESDPGGEIDALEKVLKLNG